jgi:hypothetical protein
MRRRHQPKPGWNDETDPMTPAPTPAQIDKQIDEATKEVTDTVGMGGSLGRVRSGGVGIKTGAGMEAIVGGVRKTQVEPDGDFFVGSDIDDPAGLSLAVFVNAQNWNGEDMEEGDALFGDNSEGSSNIKWDASEGQWQFRVGTTVQVYMDTDGTIKAGGGDVTIDQWGVTFENQEGQLAFKDTSGDDQTIAIYSDGNDYLALANSVGGKGIVFFIDDASHNVTQIDIRDDGIMFNDTTSRIYYGASTATPMLDWGTYTPVVYGDTNVNTVTVNGDWMYSITGGIGHASGSLIITPTAGGAATTRVEIDFPVASGITNTTQAAGGGVSSAFSTSGAVSSDATDDCAALVFLSPTTSAMTWRVWFDFQIL